MPTKSYKIKLMKEAPVHEIKELKKEGDTLREFNTYTFKVVYEGINLVLTLSGSMDDIRKNFSQFNFHPDPKNKYYLQMDLKTKISQKVLDQFPEIIMEKKSEKTDDPDDDDDPVDPDDDDDPVDPDDDDDED